MRDDGEMIAIGYNLVDVDGDGETEVTVSVFDPGSGRRSRRTVVRVARPSMQHDVGVTATRTVLLDGPLVFDLDRVLAGGLPFAFETDQTMRVGIMPRHPSSESSSEPRWIDTGEPCFAYHVVNCHDAVDETTGRSLVVVDACKSDATNALGMARGFESGGVNGYVGEDAGRGTIRPGPRRRRAEDDDDDERFGLDEDERFGLAKANASVSRPSSRPSRTRSPPSSRRPPRTILETLVAPRHRPSARTQTPWAKGATWRRCGDGRLTRTPGAWCRASACARARVRLPAIHPGRVGVAYRYAYSAGYAPGTAPTRRMDIPSFDRVLMHDVERKTHSEFLGGNRVRRRAIRDRGIVARTSWTS